MSQALKVMTFNVQQLPSQARTTNSLPLAGSPGRGAAPGVEARAQSVARSILDLPVREQPDIIAFNEVVGETARTVLVRELKPAYPHIVDTLAHLGAGVEGDSGQMLFSKLPLLELPGGADHLYRAFAAKTNDATDAKGVCIVRVKGPFDPTTIAFTHLQASSDAANSENAGVREDQLRVVRRMLLDVAGGNLEDYANSVVIGDLNIKGDPDDTGGEHDLVFGDAPDTFGADFDDGWRLSMHAPGDPTAYDRGYSQRDTPTSRRNRFDYQCTRRDANDEAGLVPHQMSMPLGLPSEVTDHWALLAHLHRVGPNCSPARAVELLTLDPVNKKRPESLVWNLTTSVRDADMYHWIYISEPGTFSIVTTPDVEVAAFRRTDFTHPLEPTDTLRIDELPGGVQSALAGAADNPATEGTTYSWREPFFIRLRGTLPTFAHSAPYSIIRHRGDSPASALILHPHFVVDPGLPLGQKLGATDECYFKARRTDKFTSGAYNDRFELRNVAKAKASLELRDAAQTPQAKNSGNGELLGVTRNAGAEAVYLVLRRINVNEARFGVYWDSPLTYVRLDESFRLHVDDENGADLPGVDEFDLNVNIDGDKVISRSSEDTGSIQEWPSFSNSEDASKWAAFTGEIAFTLLKTNGTGEDGSLGGVIRALDSSDRDEEDRTAALTLASSVGDGHITARASLSKYPPV